MAKEISEEEKKRIEEMIDGLVKRAKKASEEKATEVKDEKSNTFCLFSCIVLILGR